MILYAVKHKAENLWLPWVKGSNSKAELTDPREQTPRLFKSYRAASYAMHAWARGIHRGHGSWQSSDCEYGSGGSYFELDEISITPQRHRRLSDVTVIEINMNIREVCLGT